MFMWANAVSFMRACVFVALACVDNVGASERHVV